MEHFDELYQTCEYLERDLAEMNKRIAASGGKLNSDTLKYLEMLTHSMKSVKTTIAMAEAEMNGYSGRRDNRSYDGRSYGGNSYDGMSMDGNSYGGNSYARGRGSNAKRDSMGRYSRDGYSGRDGYSREGNEEALRRVNELMSRVTEPQFKNELQHIARDLEQM